MKCRLCDRPTPVGNGKLCLDCTKALHRARASSAATRTLPASPPAPVDALAATAAPLALGPMSALAPLWRRRAVWTAVGLAAIGIAYVGQSHFDRWQAPEPIAVGDRAPRALAARPPAEVPAVSTPEEARLAAQVNAAEVPGPSPAPQAKAESHAAKAPISPAVAKATPKTGTASTSPNRNSSASSSTYTPANDTQADKSKAPSNPEASQLLARANVSPSTPSADGAQASALEKCGKEAFLSRFICEQKMYMQYCEDKWDKDPRCMRRSGSN